MTWPESQLPGGHQVAVYGEPAIDLVELDGIFLPRRELTAKDRESLQKVSEILIG
jgi:hypothetical protein